MVSTRQQAGAGGVHELAAMPVEQREALGQAVRQAFLKNYTRAVLVDKYEKLLEETVKMRKMRSWEDEEERWQRLGVCGTWTFTRRRLRRLWRFFKSLKSLQNQEEPDRRCVRERERTLWARSGETCRNGGLMSDGNLDFDVVHWAELLPKNWTGGISGF